MNALFKLIQFISKSVNPLAFRAHSPAISYFEMLGINLENKMEKSNILKSFNKDF